MPKIMNVICKQICQQKKKLENKIYILIGSNIKSIRESKGMTQLDVAVLCDFEKTTISRIEAGRTNITVKNLFKLSQALGVMMKDLIDIQ